MRRILALSLCLLAATACESNPPRVQRSEFEDIPVPKGLTVDLNMSTMIDGPDRARADIQREDPHGCGIF